MSAPGIPDRNKRLKPGEGPLVGPPIGGGYGHAPPSYGHQPHFQQAPSYGNQQQYPPPMQYGAHMQYGQQPPPGPPQGYASQTPPQMWGGQQPQQGQPNMGVYRQGAGPPNGMATDRAGYAYRAPQQQMAGQAPSHGRPMPPPPQGPTNGSAMPANSPTRVKTGGHPQQGKAPGGYWQGQPQWSQHQWGGPGGPPPPPHHGWQGGPPMVQQPGPSPPPNMPQHMQSMSGQKMWSNRQVNGMTSPPRQPRGSPEGMMNGYSGMNGMPDTMHKSVGMDGSGDMDMYMARGLDDGSTKSKMSQADKDKGRGSYRCGRCGAPKKGHVCPYQPKLKRRPDEPPPVMRNAALQVEMDEFMTLRRLNIEIQGFPESYATAPIMADNMVVGEPHPLALAPMSQPEMMSTGVGPDQSGEHEDTMGDPQPEEMRSSPRSSSRGSPSMEDDAN